MRFCAALNPVSLNPTFPDTEQLYRTLKPETPYSGILYAFAVRLREENRKFFFCEIANQSRRWFSVSNSLHVGLYCNYAQIYNAAIPHKRAYCGKPLQLCLSTAVPDFLQPVHEFLYVLAGKMAPAYSLSGNIFCAFQNVKADSEHPHRILPY